MFVEGVSHARVVTQQLIHLCMHALDGLLTVETHRVVSAGKARDVDGQHVQFESDGLEREILLEFGAKGTTMLGEGSNLLFTKKTISGVEFVALGEQLE